MFKKAAQIAATFTLLVGAFLAYTHAFALVEYQLSTGRTDDGSMPFPETDSNSTLHANQLARECFPAGHWATLDDLKMVYFDPGRSCYMYAQTYRRLNDGKTIEVKPFAMISESKDGKARKTVTSDMAVIDLSQPFGFVKVGSEPSRVTHALLSGNVHIRDDKGTIADPDDDLRVSFDPGAVVEYDEKTLKITTESQVIIQDRDLTMTGLGMMIQLRRKAPTAGAGGGTTGGGTAGFNAESATLWKDVHIVANNVTPNGILPGASKPDGKGKTPLDLRCEGAMVVTLPRPHPTVEVGPPHFDRPPDPTFAKFHVNVRVRRGTTAIDQLNSDTLDLTLMPDRKPDLTDAELVAQAKAASEGGEPPAAPGSGPLTELKLRKALAQGHSVWIQSESSGLKARCIELTYEKHDQDGQPDKTYLNGGPSNKLYIEKVDLVQRGEKAGTIESFRIIKALDTTIFDYGPSGRSRVVARGPGTMDERPERNASIDRTVFWEDQMENLTWRDDPPASVVPAGSADPKTLGILRRQITLTGPSKLVDYKGNATLDAADRIVVEFKSDPKPFPLKGDGPAQIQWLHAFKDVHMTSGSKVLTARDQLDAKFEQKALVVVPPPAFVPGPIVAQAAPPPPPEEKPDKGPEPVEPAVDGRAHYVYATILQDEGAKKSEVKDAKLRGGVMVHQDPAVGETYGKDATGEALDLFSQGKGLMRFVVSAEEPHAANARAKLASNKERTTLPIDLAKVSFDGRTIEGPLIGLDQLQDYAWVQGPGNFVQMAERGLLTEAGLGSTGATVIPGKKPNPGGAKDRMVITWNGDMKFFGLSKDLLDRPAAKAEFRGISEEVRTPNGKIEYRRGVQAKQEESAIFCDSMDVYMDKPINFKRDVTKTAPAAGKAPEPDAQIAMLDCRGDNVSVDGKFKHAGVEITSRKRYPGTDFIRELQRIRHTHVAYDKRTGNFEAPGAGIVYLYQAEEPKKKEEAAATARTISDASRPQGSGYIPKKQPTYKLTKVKFNEGMRGKFTVAKDQEPRQASESEFAGNVQAINAVVESTQFDVDFDNYDRAVDPLSISSDILRVFSFPAPADSKAPARQQLNGQGNALARTIDRTITGDRITYDSASDLMFVYGEDGKEVGITEQKSAGQVYNKIHGRSAYYNKRTHEGSVVDPAQIQMYDLKSGIRPKPFYPDLGGTPKPMDPIKAQRMPLMRPSRNSTERNPFTGR